MGPRHSYNLTAVMEAHAPAAIRWPLDPPPPSHSYLRDSVNGAADGTGTTFSVVSGAAWQRLRAGVALVLGVANVIADGFSMAVGNVLAARAERQLIERARRMGERHVDDVRLGEFEEVRRICACRGFSGDEVERALWRGGVGPLGWAGARKHRCQPMRTRVGAELMQ